MGSLLSKATRLGEQLCKACEEGDLKKVERLVKAGADLNYKKKVMTIVAGQSVTSYKDKSMSS